MSVGIKCYVGLFVDIKPMLFSLDEEKREFLIEEFYEKYQEDMEFIVEGYSGKYYYFGKVLNDDKTEMTETYEYNLSMTRMEVFEDYKKQIKDELAKYDIEVDEYDIKFKFLKHIE